MTNGLRVAFALLLTCAVAPRAEAAVFLFSTTLSGLAESPPNASPGTGTGFITFNDTARTMRVQVTFSGLLSPTTASHIHILVPPATVGPVVTQTPTFAGFPLGVTSGSYDNVFDLSAASTYNASFLNNAMNMGSTVNAQASLLAGLRDGNAYLNIHSMQFGGGEIRGTLAAVPEPAEWALMIGGFGMTGGALRRRRSIAA